MNCRYLLLEATVLSNVHNNNFFHSKNKYLGIVHLPLWKIWLRVTSKWQVDRQTDRQSKSCTFDMLNRLQIGIVLSCLVCLVWLIWFYYLAANCFLKYKWSIPGLLLFFICGVFSIQLIVNTSLSQHLHFCCLNIVCPFLVQHMHCCCLNICPLLLPVNRPPTRHL